MKLQKQKSTNNTLSILILMMVTLLYYNGYAQQPTLIWFGTFGGNSSEARAVSVNGTVVAGVADDSNGNPRAFR